MATKLDNNPVLKLSQDSILWRYFDITKLLWLLFNESLYFARADQFSDEFEGTWPKIDIKKFKGKIKEVLSAPGIKDETRKLILENSRKSREREKRSTYVNCWHLNKDENMAMWSIYGHIGKIVAIQTTLGELLESLPNYVSVGCVIYRNYITESLFQNKDELITPFLYKRAEYKYENELRCIVYKPEGVSFDLKDAKMNDSIGLSIKLVNISNFIQCVIISPKADSWIEDILYKLLNLLRIEIKVCHSSMDEGPFI